MKTNEQLQQDVMEELKWDPIVAASEVGVAVKNGIVTLSGYVDSYSKKYAAEKAAKRVKGVVAVAEDITVRLNSAGERDDTAIAEAILNAFKWNSSIPNELVQLKVDGGWVTLEGNVDWQYQKDAIRHAVQDVTGVTGVTNLITLKPRVNAGVVEKNIRRALQRSANIRANNIKIQAQGSKVILSGKANTWSERREAEKAAWSSPGVTEVEDNLAIVAL